ncbi:fasciclin domain-containing protein [Maribacter chungangensis]|uniref:Fasciclin domain-containing protein n=1 Tax=Maribacter chungangensis TaxID=1069117 RepID=A0ABW3B4U3_9FLAO
MKNRDLIIISTLLLCVLLLSCGNKEKKPATASIKDKTPIATEKLSDLESDVTFNDIRSVLDVLGGNTDYDIFYKALKSANLLSTLDSIEDITIFAPTNAAFKRITEAKLAHLKSPDGTIEMATLLKYHIVEDEYDLETLESTIRLNENILRLKTFNGGFIALTIENNDIYISDETGFQSKIIMPDQEAENGVVHGIDPILLAQ